MTSRTTNSMGFLSWLLMAFIVLKLCDAIDWSWWWVMAPMWAPVALLLVLSGVGFPIAFWLDSRKAHR